MHSVLQKNVERETALTEKKETNALLALLAHEIFDQAMDIDASTVDWSAVLAEAQRHKVTALMYPEIRSMDGVPEAVFNKVCGTAIAVADVLTDAYDVSGKGRNSLFRNYIRYLKKYLRQNEPWAKSRLWLPVFGVFLPARWGVRVLLGKRKKVNLMHAAGMAREREKLLRELELYR